MNYLYLAIEETARRIALDVVDEMRKSTGFDRIQHAYDRLHSEAAAEGVKYAQAILDSATKQMAAALEEVKRRRA